MFFELLQVALGNRERLSRVPSDKEWEEIYDESGRQAVTGLLLHGIDRLPAEQRPSQALLLQWIGEGQVIEQQNRVLDERCCQLLKNLEEQGVRGTILKGQGIDLLYSENLRPLRQSGDIDVYVDCGLKRALEFAHSMGQNSVEWDYKHLHLNVWDDTEVEMHHRVEVLLNLWKNRRLQKWFKTNTALLFCHDYDITTPTLVFNVFYILLHIYRHFLYEGVGLRQIVDYYFVLRSVNLEKQSVGYALDTVSNFGIDKFAGGLMWVMKDALGMPEEWMLWEPDRKEGDNILKQVMEGGNFGHYKKKNKKIGGKFGTFLRICSNNMHLFIHYPSDTIWAPFYFTCLKLWKIKARIVLK